MSSRPTFGISAIPQQATEILEDELQALEPNGMHRYWSSGEQAIAVMQKASAIRSELRSRREAGAQGIGGHN